LLPVDSELDLRTHLKYLETLFDYDHAMGQLDAKHTNGTIDEMKTLQLTKADRATFRELHQIAKNHLDRCAFNWIGPAFWKGLLGPNPKRSSVTKTIDS
jgi:hypothetical protein